MLSPLTDRQKLIYDFLVRTVLEKGYAPSIQEIGHKFRIASTNGVFRFVGAEYHTFPDVRGSIGATIMLGIGPVYPTRHLVEREELRTAVRDRVIGWRQVGFPIRGGDRYEPITQLDSVLRIHPGGAFSLLDVSVWGQVFFAMEVERLYESPENQSQVLGIHLSGLIGHLLAFLEYTRVLYGTLPYDGPLVASLLLRRVHNKPFIYFPYGTPEPGPASRFDDDITVEIPLSTAEVRGDRDLTAKRILRELFFVLNWADHGADEAALTAMIKQGYEYCMWRWPGT